MALKMQRKSLADQIGDLLTIKPKFLDSDEEPDNTKAKVVEHYDEKDVSDDEFRQSNIRKQNIDTLDKVDERYAGKKVSRKDVYSDNDNDDDDSASDDLQSENSAEDVEDEEMNGTLEESEDNMDSDEEDHSQEGSEDAESMLDSMEEEDYDADINDRQGDSTIKTMSETNVELEIKKGNCVRDQLKLWESLLEIRIKLQKCVVTSNQMPQYDVHKEFSSDVDFAKKIDETKMKFGLLLNNMLQLKDFLLKGYPETKDLCTESKKRKIRDTNGESTDEPMDEEIPSDTENELENGRQESSASEDAETSKDLIPRKRLKYNDCERALQRSHSSYTEYRDTVIKKWNEKTRIATGSLNKDSGHTTLKQIEFAMSDISKLRKRTQLKRSEYNIVGKSLPIDDLDGRRVQEYDPEIYDDDDFYHQLLRDLIEYKSSDVTDPIQLSKQWIQLQNMRKKMKRKIDTRATKGRRVRYNVHNKLVNFTAPITVCDTWTDTAKNELYNSLFGKIKPAEEQINK